MYMYIHIHVYISEKPIRGSHKRGCQIFGFRSFMAHSKDLVQIGFAAELLQRPCKQRSSLAR